MFLFYAHMYDLEIALLREEEMAGADTLPCRVCLAHNSSTPQEKVPLNILTCQEYNLQCVHVGVSNRQSCHDKTSRAFH